MGEDNSILYLFGLSMQDKGKGNRFLNLIKNHGMLYLLIL